MRKIMTAVLALAFLLVGVLPAAAQGDKNIVEIASGDDRFETLVTAVQAAGLVETLQGAGPFTVFAPTDDAFAAIPKATLDMLLADKEMLTAVLTYHVVSGKVLAADAVAMAGQDAATVQGETIKVSTMGSSVMVNDATVIVADVVASNGVIHAIDKVLLPPSVAAQLSAASAADNAAATTTAAPGTIPATGGERSQTVPLVAVAAGLLLLGTAYTLRVRMQ